MKRDRIRGQRLFAAIMFAILIVLALVIMPGNAIASHQGASAQEFAPAGDNPVLNMTIQQQDANGIAECESQVRNVCTGDTASTDGIQSMKANGADIGSVKWRCSGFGCDIRPVAHVSR